MKKRRKKIENEPSILFGAPNGSIHCVPSVRREKEVGWERGGVRGEKEQGKSERGKGGREGSVMRRRGERVKPVKPPAAVVASEGILAQNLGNASMSTMS